MCPPLVMENSPTFLLKIRRTRGSGKAGQGGRQPLFSPSQREGDKGKEDASSRKGQARQDFRAKFAPDARLSGIGGSRRQQSFAVELLGHPLVVGKNQDRHEKEKQPEADPALLGQRENQQQCNEGNAEIFCQAASGDEQRGQRQAGETLPFQAFDPKEQRPNPKGGHHGVAHQACGAEQEAGRDERRQGGGERMPAETARPKGKFR